MSLQRFIERLIWLCMLPLIILGAVLLTLHLNTLNHRRQMLVDSVTRAAARSLDHMLEVRLSSLSLLGRMLDDGRAHRGGELNLPRAHRLAQEYVSLHGHHVLIAADGREMLVNTGVPWGQPLPPLPVPVGRSAMSIALASNTPTVGDPFIGPVAGVPMVALVVPLHVTSRQRLLLLTTVETAQLRDRLMTFSLPKDWVLGLNDSTGAPMFAGSTAASTIHGPGLRSTASLNQTPWMVVLSAPPVSFFDDPLWRTALLIGTLAVTVFLAYAGARTASRRLIGDMQALIGQERERTGKPPIEELAQVRHELQRLAREREAAQEAERRRIGLELHDELQQKLSLMRHDLRNWKGEEAERVRGLVNDTIDATRRLVQDLRPPILLELGLPDALQSLGEQHQQAHGQSVDVLIREGLPWESLPEATATALYRIAQEALNNARKHSQANSIHISLNGQTGPTGRQEGEVVMEVADDGVGFDRTSRLSTATNGLRGMQERARALGGRLEVISSTGEGTALIAHLPWPPSPRGDEPAG